MLRRLPGSCGNSVLLTFDDGPCPEVTPKVLDLLDEFRARAVFFVIGNRIDPASPFLNEITSRGHLLGNHTYHHHDHDILDGYRRSHFSDFVSDIRQCQQVVEQFANVTPTLFRPPGGCINRNSIFAPMKLGLQHVSWSLDVDDWRFETANQARRGAEEIVRRARPRDIVLLHDDNERVLEVLRHALPRLVDAGLNLAQGIRVFEGHRR